MRLERTLAVWLIEQHPEAAAPVLAGMKASTVAETLAEASVQGAARVVSALGPTLAAEVLNQAEVDWGAHVLEQLPPAAAGALLERIGSPRRDEFYGAMPSRLASALRQRSSYDRNSAATLMDEEAVALPGSLTVRDAVQFLRDSGTHVPALFVVDDRQRFVGIVSAEQLLVAKPQRALADLMVKDAIPISSATTHGRLLEHPAWRSAANAAVVDAEGQLLGSLSLRTVVRAAEATTRGGRSDPGETSAALGDLFWLGIAGVLGAAAGGEPRTGRG